MHAIAAAHANMPSPGIDVIWSGLQVTVGPIDLGDVICSFVWLGLACSENMARRVTNDNGCN